MSSDRSWMWACGDEWIRVFLQMNLLWEVEDEHMDDELYQENMSGSNRPKGDSFGETFIPRDITATMKAYFDGPYPTFCSMPQSIRDGLWDRFMEKDMDSPMSQLEFFSHTHWKNQGLRHFVDKKSKRVHDTYNTAIESKYGTVRDNQHIRF
ncbi:uncharacterized protein LOC111411819 isoform X2 [Olea europaea var. sylvestris]|nr:uncharacterized protein LOC111411819 isoform X2 [Olea europaea var. sylvestris]